MIVRATIEKGFIDHHAGIEIYYEGRFFTVTGHLMDEYPSEVQNRQEELTALLSELSPPKREPKTTPPRARSQPGVNRIVIRQSRQLRFCVMHDATDTPTGSKSVKLCTRLMRR